MFSLEDLEGSAEGEDLEGSAEEDLGGEALSLASKLGKLGIVEGDSGAAVSAAAAGAAAVAVAVASPSPDSSLGFEEDAEVLAESSSCFCTFFRRSKRSLAVGLASFLAFPPIVLFFVFVVFASVASDAEVAVGVLVLVVFGGSSPSPLAVVVPRFSHLVGGLSLRSLVFLVGVVGIKEELEREEGGEGSLQSRLGEERLE